MPAVSAVRIGAPLAWALATILLVAGFGVPTSRELVLAWVLAGMLAFSATKLRHRLPRLVVDWAPFVALLLVYDLLRGVADGLLFPALFFWPVVPWWARPLLAVYPVAMAFALVYTGEHYVVDCLAGWVYAAVAFVVVSAVFDRKRVVSVAGVFAD